MSENGRGSGVSLRAIDFGRSNAHEEASAAPDLLISGYVDDGNAVNEVLKSRKWLVLGSKGTGKSALGRHIQLIHEALDINVSINTVADFPFLDFHEVVESRNDLYLDQCRAWRWILAILLGRALKASTKATLSKELARFMLELERKGVGADASLGQVIERSREVDLSASILGLTLRASRRSDSKAIPASLIDAMDASIVASTVSCQHLIFIDGLDDLILEDARHQLESLSALVVEATNVNRRLTELGKDIKVVVLIRPELFARLRGSNINKIYQDSSIVLDWFRPNRGAVVRELLNAKARVSGFYGDVLDEFFPPSIGRDTMDIFLAKLTRHRPRDILQLARYVGLASSGFSGQVPARVVRDGIIEYTRQYFVREIRDELDGVIGGVEADGALRTLRDVSARGFTEADLRAVSPRSWAVESVDYAAVLSALIDCGAVGVVKSTQSDLRRRPIFKFEDQHLSPRPFDRYRLHNSLAIAFSD